MNYTQNLHLPQWEGSDRIHHDDFNEAFEKIDEGIAACGNCKIITGSYTGTGGSNGTLRRVTLPAEPKLMFLIGNHGTSGTQLYKDIDVYCGGRWLVLNSNGSSWQENSGSNYPQINGTTLTLNGNQHNAANCEETFLILC